jgi:phage terminase large subunit-like protein
MGVPERDNERFARLINDPVYRALWGDRVRLVRQGIAIVENSATGWKRVTSTGGGVTGFRGDRLLLDDLNNPINVESDDVRQATARFVREIMPDRLNDLKLSAIINLQQRTHEGDATGVLLEHGTGYTNVCVPMEFDPLRFAPIVLRYDEEGEPDLIWRDPRGLGDDGEPLSGLYSNARGELRVRPGSPMAKAEGALCWPERFPREEVEALRAIKGQYAWDSQFQQYPGVRGGGIVRKEWWRLWSASDYPALGTVVVSVDTAVEESQSADFNACTVWGLFQGTAGEPQFLLLEAWQERLPLAKLVERVARTCRTRNADYLLIEHKTRGRDVHDEIRRHYVNATWQTVLVLPERSKVARLRAVEHLFSGDYRKDPNGVEYWEGGMIYAPDRDFADEVINQVASFPYGQHDDYVDSVTQALGWMRKVGVVLRKVEHEIDEEEAARYRKPLGVPYSI